MGTVSFFPEDKREALTKMGTITGRHKTDKDALAGLTVRDLGEAVTYEEAEITFLCRKIYSADMLTRHMPAEVVKDFYTPDSDYMFSLNPETYSMVMNTALKGCLQPTTISESL